MVLRTARDTAGSDGLDRPEPTPAPLALRHRDDIDGLRAIAVLPVVAFHYGLSRVASGGYVGVDVFFVISGFLITRILMGSPQGALAGTTVFYGRRIRRIFPALIAVYLACVAASLLLQFPSEVWGTVHGLLASLTFWSNLYFAGQSGYFDQASATNPLLHTWSLSVEEQFYLAFPPLLFLARRWAPGRISLVLWLAFAASLAAAIWAEATKPAAAFYFVQYRAWELLIGSLLAVDAVPLLASRWLAEALGIAGLLMIAGAAHFYTAATPFPGATALLPCVGAAFVIWSGAAAQTWTRRVLSLTPLRVLGLISYSLYLWHWPVWVYGSLVRQPYGFRDKLVFIAVALLLAVLSWRFVEQPFRRPARRLTDRRVIGIGLAGMAATATIAVAAAVLGPMLWPVSPQALAVLAHTDDNSANPVLARGCFLNGDTGGLEAYNKDACLSLDPGRRNMLLIGDSHAAHLVTGLEHAFPDWHLLVAVAIGCKPIVGAGGQAGCVALDRYIFDDFLEENRLDAVVLSGRWTLADVGPLADTVRMLKPLVGTVIVSGPIVEYDEPLPRLLARGLDRDVEALAARHRRAEPATVDKALASAVRDAGGRYVSVVDALCTPACKVWAQPGVPLQFDYGHLTPAGSDVLGAALRPQMRLDEPVP